jgi:hypothetical protein
MRGGGKIHRIDGDELEGKKVTREFLTSKSLKNGNHALPTAVVSSEK